MIAENIKYLHYCSEELSKVENYEKALADKENMWDCHHKDEIRILPSGLVVLRTREELIENGRYYNCPANELIFMLREEHRALHGKYSFLGKHHKNRNTKNLRKPKSSFGKWFYETYKIRPEENMKLYQSERYRMYKEGFFE